MKTAALLLAPLALAACATSNDAPISSAGPPLPQGSVAALGQPVTVGQLVATPQSVEEDSRCPINARCVWAGRAIVTVRIDGAGWRETELLTLGEPHATHGITITLTSVEPGKMAGGAQTDPKDYRFGFEGGN